MTSRDHARLLRVLRPVPHPRIRLVCVPYAGGASTIFHGWPDSLPVDVQVVAIQLPGRQDRFHEKPIVRVTDVVEQIAAAMAALPPLPTALFGHSFGALVAFELARRMQAAGMPAACVILGARRPPHASSAYSPIHKLPDAGFLQAIHVRYGTPWSILGNRDVMDLVLPAFRADVEALETYTYVPGAELEAPVTVLCGRDDASAPISEVAKWIDLVRDPVAIHEVGGGHFFVDTHRAWVLEHVRAALQGIPAAG